MSYHLQQPVSQQGGTAGIIDTSTNDVIKLIKAIDTPAEFFILIVLLIFIGWLAYLIASNFKKVSGENGHTVRKGRLGEETFHEIERIKVQTEEMREDLKEFIELNRLEHKECMQKIDRLQDKLFSLALLQNQHPYLPEPPEKQVRRIPVRKKK